MGYSLLQISEILLKADKTTYRLGTIAYENMFSEDSEDVDFERDIIYIYKKAVEYADDFHVGTTKLDQVVERLANKLVVYNYGQLNPIYSNAIISNPVIPTGSVLNDLNDVTITNLQDNQILRYSASLGQWVNTGPNAAIRSTQAFTATLNQTVFVTTSPFTAPLLDVYLNGVRLNSSSYSTFGNYTITLYDGCLADDILDVTIYDPQTSILDMAGYVKNTRTITINGLTQDLSADRTWTLPTGDMTKAVYDIDNDGIVDDAEKITVIARNSTGSTIHKGKIVYLQGSTGNRPNMILAQANSEATSSKTFGVVVEDIAHNADGHVAAIGTLHDLDTRSNATNPFTTDTLLDGDLLWLSATNAGYVTRTVPTQPNHAVFIGVVARTTPNLGRIVYKIQNGYELQELHNVSISSPADGQVLKYNATTGLWYNGTDLGSNIYNSDGTLTGNRTVSAGGYTLTLSPKTIFNFTGFADNVIAPIGISFTPTFTATLSNSLAYGVDISPTFNTAGGAYLTAAALRLGNSTGYGILQSNSSVISLFNGRVDIGGASTGAIAKLEVLATGSRGIRVIGNDPTNGGVVIGSSLGNTFALIAGITSQTQNGFTFRNLTTNSDLYTIHNNGNTIFGGTTDAGYKLDVQGTARITGETTVDNNFYITGSGSVRTIFVNGYTTGLRLSASSSIGNFDLFKGFGYARISSINEPIRYDSPSHLFGGTTYVSSALVNIESTTQGFLAPRMTTTQRDAIASPATGLQVYNTTTNKVSVYNGTSWADVGGDNIYTADGILTSARTVTSGGFNLTFTGTNTAASTIARGISVTHTLNASANNDSLVGLEINPTYSSGAYTGVNKVGIRIRTAQTSYTSYDKAIQVFNGSGTETVYVEAAQGRVGAFLISATQFTTGAGYAIQGFGGGETSFIGGNTSGGNGDIGFWNQIYAGGGTQYGKWFGTTGNLLIQYGGTFTDAGYKLDVKGTARVSGNTLIVGSTNLSTSNALSVYNTAGNELFSLRNDKNLVVFADGSMTLGSSTINSTPSWGISLGLSYITGPNFYNGYNQYFASSDGGNIIPYMAGNGANGLKIEIQTTSTFQTSALLQVNSTTKGFLPPRMTSTQKSAISTPATGLVVYQTDSTEGLYQYKSTGWEAIGGGGTPAGSNTQIQYNNSGAFGASAGLTYDDSVGTMTLSKNYGAATKIKISNTNNSSAADARLEIETNGGIVTLGRFWNGAPAYKIIEASDGYLHSQNSLAFVADNIGGKFKWAAGASSTAQMTLTAAGRLLLGTTTESTYILDVVGNSKINGFTFNSGGNLKVLDSFFGINTSTNLELLGFDGNANFAKSFSSAYILNGRIRLSYIDDISKIDGFASASFNNSFFDIVASGTGNGNPTPMRIYTGGGNIIIAHNGTSTVGRVGIGTASPNTSALLDITSTTKGFLQPRMTTTERNAIASPATGLQVYNTTTNTNDYYNGTAWVSAAAGNIYTADGALTGDRVVSNGAYTLTIKNASNISAALIVQNTQPYGTGSVYTQYSQQWLSPTGTVQGYARVDGKLYFDLVHSPQFYVGSLAGIIDAGVSRGGSIGINGAPIDFGTATHAGGGTNIGRWYGTGNLLIQTGGTFTDAGYKLDVQGTARVTSDATAKSFVATATTTMLTGEGTYIDHTVGAYGRLFSYNNSTGSFLPVLMGSSRLVMYNSLGSRTEGLVGNSASFANDVKMLSASNYFGATENNGIYAPATYSNTSYPVIENNSIGIIAGVSAVSNPAWIVATKISFQIGTGVNSKIGQFSPTTGNLILQGGGTYTDVASARLQVNSTTQGFLPPRMTATQLAAISSPAVGLVAYQTDGTEGLYQYKSTGWTLVAGSGGGSGTVTSVDMSVPTGFAISGNPVTTSGTLALAFASGYSLPTTASQTNWDTAYTNRITSLTTTGSSGAATLVSNVLNVPTYTLAGLGGQPLATNLTSLSGLTYASDSFVKMTASGTFTLDTNSYYLASNPNGYTSNTGTVTGTSTSGYVAFWNGTSSISGNSNLYWDNTNSRLGFGSSAPLAPIHLTSYSSMGSRDYSLLINTPSGIGARFAFTSNSGGNAVLMGETTNGAGNFSVKTTSNADWVAQTAIWTDRFIVNNNGRVLIGTTTDAGAYNLQLTGQLRLNSYISTTSYTGTAAGYLGFDSSGNILTVAAGTAGAGGTTGQLQYNNSGVLAGAAYVNVNQGHIELIDAGTLPTAPATGRVILFSEDHAGKSLPSVLGPSGVDYNLQAALYGNTTYMWMAGTGTTVAINWGTSFTARNNGTSAAQSHPTKASTNAMTSMNRANFGTGTTATGASGIQTAATVAWLGNAAGLGGFLFFARFGIETLASDVRAFVGLSANNATMAADASTWANTIGIGKDTADSTWQIISRSATTLTKTNTTITVTQNQILDVYIHSAPNSGTIRVHIKDGATGADLYVSGALTTNIPAATTFLYMQAHIQSVTGTTAKSLALNRMYLETDL